MTKCIKNLSEIIQNEKKSQKSQKNLKRVFTNMFLCGKLWEKLMWGSLDEI